MPGLPNSAIIGPNKQSPKSTQEYLQKFERFVSVLSTSSWAHRRDKTQEVTFSESRACSAVTLLSSVPKMRSTVRELRQGPDVGTRTRIRTYMSTHTYREEGEMGTQDGGRKAQRGLSSEDIKPQGSNWHVSFKQTSNGLGKNITRITTHPQWLLFHLHHWPETFSYWAVCS